jgi:dCMP deaminase
METARTNRISWDDRFMLEALIASLRSPDPNTQVGAAIISSDKKIIASGYNGWPRGIGLNSLPWTKDSDNPLENKYPYVVHAEKNAIHNACTDIHGSTLYVTMYPCNECCKDVIQAGIKKVIYLENPYENTWQVQASKTMFDLLDIPNEQYQWKDKTLVAQNLSSLITRL